MKRFIVIAIVFVLVLCSCSSGANDVSPSGSEPTATEPSVVDATPSDSTEPENTMYKYVTSLDQSWTEPSSSHDLYCQFSENELFDIDTFPYMYSPLLDYVEQQDWKGLSEELGKRFSNVNLVTRTLDDEKVACGVRAGRDFHEISVSIIGDSDVTAVKVDAVLDPSLKENWDSTVQFMQDISGVELSIEDIQWYDENREENKVIALRDSSTVLVISLNWEEMYTITISRKSDWWNSPGSGVVEYIGDDICYSDDIDTLPDGWNWLNCRINKSFDQGAAVPMPSNGSYFYSGGTLKWYYTQNYDLSFKVGFMDFDRTYHDVSMLVSYVGSSVANFGDPWLDAVKKKEIIDNDKSDRLFSEFGAFAIVEQEDGYLVRMCLPDSNDSCRYIRTDITVKAKCDSAVELLDSLVDHLLTFYQCPIRVKIFDGAIAQV